MIGNDVVDLQLSRIESNWQRKGFLNKIFTKNEQILIQNSENQEITIWNLWSRKEAAYKIWNRETGIRKYNPTQFECLDLDSEIGKVAFESKLYFSKTEMTNEFIYTIAVSEKEDFLKIITLDNSIEIQKKNGIPFFIFENQVIKYISKTHHGQFEIVIGLRDSQSRF
jgi:phosphopantetheinyl transferase (holo-ACP synthase)